MKLDAGKSVFRIFLLAFFISALFECKKESRQTASSLAAPETTYAYIRCMFDTLGARYAEIDTVQKSFQMPDGIQKTAHEVQLSGQGFPVYSPRTGRSLRWTLASDAAFKMQTLSTDSTGNFYFNQPVDYASLKELFNRGNKNRFQQVPFKIIHRDSIISFICEEYVP